MVLGDNATDGAGHKLDMVPDVDGDGYDELLVTAPQNIYYRYGQAALLLGPTTGTLAMSQLDLVVDGEVTDDLGFMDTLAVGDITGDGTEDLAISGFYSYRGGYYNGSVYLFSGTTTGSRTSSQADVIIDAVATSAWLGISVEGDQDLDGDGHTDLMLGSAVGTAWGWNGPISADQTTDTADWSISLSQSDGDCETVALGDLDGDGVIDLAIGSPDASEGGLSANGTIRIAPGPVSAITSSSDFVATLYGTSDSGWVGGYRTGMSTHDLDGDGMDELIMGSASPTRVGAAPARASWSTASCQAAPACRRRRPTSSTATPRARAWGSPATWATSTGMVRRTCSSGPTSPGMAAPTSSSARSCRTLPPLGWRRPRALPQVLQCVRYSPQLAGRGSAKRSWPGWASKGRESTSWRAWVGPRSPCMAASRASSTR